LPNAAALTICSPRPASAASDRVQAHQRGTADLPRIEINLQICRAEIDPPRRSAIPLQVKTTLNQVQRFVGFVYREVRLQSHPGRAESIEILVEPHRGTRRLCSRCQRPTAGYDCLAEWLHVPDRFHITGHLNQALDQLRRAESTRLQVESQSAAQRLKHMRWFLLRRGSRGGDAPGKSSRRCSPASWPPRVPGI
jgi:hypothetical protein